jgi:hypothetical protein
MQVIRSMQTMQIIQCYESGNNTSKAMNAFDTVRTNKVNDT